MHTSGSSRSSDRSRPSWLSCLLMAPAGAPMERHHVAVHTPQASRYQDDNRPSRCSAGLQSLQCELHVGNGQQIDSAL